MRDNASGREFVELIERRYAFLMARTRVEAEARKAAREEAAS